MSNTLLTEGKGLPQFDGYETIGVLGIGGMGVVYKARQTALNRLVAIKTLRNLSETTQRDIEQFRFEAEIVAQFQHPNIVQLYHNGEQDGQPFLAFEYVDGGSLSKQIDGKQQPPRDAAQLIETLARAVHSAHLRGVVHRDLTPNNILLTKEGIPKIADFGLARMQDRSGISSDSIAGTASYMSPEQAWGDIQGKSVGPLTDVYGLGAILYELLCGRPPFKSSTSQKTLLMVYHDPPATPRSIVSAIPIDLEAICLRCLKKDPNERFESTDALANDLRRFLYHEPTTSRPVNRYERIRMWSHRNPIVAVLMFALAFVAITSFAVVTERMIAARRAETAERQRADELDASLYCNQFLLARYAFDSSDVARATKILETCNPKRRSFEWHYLYRQCHGKRNALSWQGRPIDQIVISTNGKLLAAKESNGSGMIIDSSKLIPELDIREKGSSRNISLIDASTGKVVHELVGNEYQLVPPVFSADGQTIAVVGWSGNESWIRIWNTNTGEQLKKIGPLLAGAAIQFLPGNREICSLGIDQSLFADGPGSPLVLEYWDIDLGKRNRIMKLSEKDFTDRLAIVEAAFSPNGEYVALIPQQLLMPGNKNGQKIQIFETKSGQNLHTLVQPTHLFNAHFAFGPDSQHLVSFGDEGDAIVWNILSGKPTCVLKSGIDPVLVAAFSSDGKTIATGGTDCAITLHDALTGRKLQRLDGQLGTVRSIAFSPDNLTLFSSDAKGSLSSWALDRAPFQSLTEKAGTTGLCFMNSDNSIAFTSLDAKRRSWAFKVSDSSQVISHEDLSLAVSPDQMHLAIVSAAGELRIGGQNAASSEIVPDLPALTNSRVKPLAFNPDGDELACISKDRSEVLIIDISKKKLRMRIMSPEGRFTCVSYSSDGKRLAVGSDANKIHLWDSTRKKMAGQIETEFAVWDLAARPHSDDLAAIGMETKSVQLWNVRTLERGLTIENHKFAVKCLVFTPDGRRLITGGNDRLVKVSDVESGLELLTLADAGNEVHYVAINQAGDCLAAAAGVSLIESRIVVWDVK